MSFAPARRKVATAAMISSIVAMPVESTMGLPVRAQASSSGVTRGSFLVAHTAPQCASASRTMERNL